MPDEPAAEPLPLRLPGIYAKFAIMAGGPATLGGAILLFLELVSSNPDWEEMFVFGSAFVGPAVNVVGGWRAFDGSDEQSQRTARGAWLGVAGSGLMFTAMAYVLCNPHGASYLFLFEILTLPALFAVVALTLAGWVLASDRVRRGLLAQG